MNSHLATVQQSAPGMSRNTPLTARLVLARMERIDSGSLELFEGGRHHRFGNGDPRFPAAEILVRDPRFWAAVAKRGSIGAGEAYAKEWWTSDDPTAVVRLFVRNQEALSGMEEGWARLSRPFFRLYHALRRNTERGSRENIAAHYDLSNEFFSLFLDESMTYSCGIWESPESTLLEASTAKIDRLCRKLDLRPDDHLLEIGTGWGAFAIHAAREYGCRVTTTTISAEQHAVARKRIRDAGLEDRIDLRLEDYRRLEGTFDKLVSVEMIEAVGHAYFEEFFRRCAARLNPKGVMALQAITIADQHYERARDSVDFIQRHIFPGSCIPSITALSTAMTRASDLRLVHMEEIGTHYVPTLAQWRRNLREKYHEARALGFDDELLRLWDFYFCYCEGGFAERHIGNAQLLFARPDARPEPILPALDR